MSDSVVDDILSELKGFQRDAVEHVIHRLYDDPQASGRFLVADETGLGKSVVARGVIARAIERLEMDDSVDRIDIVYVCSNADLASQNLRRLNVTGNPHLGFSSRLTLLARESNRLSAAPGGAGKPVNLVSFTPGTSFELGSRRTGSADERALLHVMLTEALNFTPELERASRILFQGSVQTEDAFSWRVRQTNRALNGPVNPRILESLIQGLKTDGSLEEFSTLVSGLIGLDEVPQSVADAVRQLTARLRSALARASVETLEPDLVILDEFQRFRHLLDPEDGGDAAELAHYLFNYEAAKVLLLSATPYKPYTASDSEDDEDHYSDFMTTLTFLSGSDSSLDDIRNGFSEYRRRVTLGHEVESVISMLRTSLLNLMSRTERPQLSAHDMLHERTLASAAPSRDDLQGFTALQRLGRELDVPIGIEYWKSIPYFANFMDSYQVSRALDRRLASDEVSGEGLGPLLGALQTIDPADVREYEPIDFGNSHLRALANETLDEGMWRLLWLPPSMPYLAPGSFYEPQEGRDLTKRVVFSSWTGTPTAVASLLSYEAERRMAQGSRLTTNSPAARKQISARLIYATDANGPQSMSSLLMFWPHPGLARVGDPLSIARRSPDLAPTAAKAEGEVYSALRNGGLGETPDFSWRSFFAMADALPGTLMADTSVLTEYLSARTGGSTEADPDDAEAGPAVSRGLGAHVAQALEAMNAGQTSGIHPDLAKLALHSPGNIAYRALGRIRAEADATTDPGCWQAAALLANGLRSLFNRVDSMLLIDSSADKSDADGEAYWRAVLRYCADGNLQAVLDEYVHQLRSESAGEPLNDSLLLDIARRAVEAITLRPSVYRARDITSNGAETIPFTARFALRYGGKHHEQESARQPEIRNAFNSPFWPFVLTSTSVGQEGIDFHWWSHAVLHWNLPANPVDFEQREGRVHRFAGHAVRKNIARDHREHVMSSDARNPWASAFEAAAASHPDLGEFSPFWVYPGDSKVERQLATFPLSRDIEKLARLKASLTLYRLTLGQPRQQDMLELMERRGIVADALPKLDLSPPRRAEIDVVERGEPGLDRVEVPARSNV